MVLPLRGEADERPPARSGPAAVIPFVLGWQDRCTGTMLTRFALFHRRFTIILSGGGGIHTTPPMVGPPAVLPLPSRHSPGYGAVQKGAYAMGQQPQGVLIAIDWENIRRGAQLHQRRVSPADLCRAMREVGSIFGQVSGGKAFGDWSLRPDDGREFAEQDIVPYHAPRTAAGKDRSDPAILLEVYDWIRDREDCATIILGSGDADYQVLVDRGRAFTGGASCCAPLASRCRGTCWPRRRCFPWRPNWGSGWRSTATWTLRSPRRRIRRMAAPMISW